MQGTIAQQFKHKVILMSVRVFVKMLESLGCELDAANIAKDGHEALQLMRQFKYDIVFLDLHMPNLGGIEVILSLLFVCASLDLFFRCPPFLLFIYFGI